MFPTRSTEQTVIGYTDIDYRSERNAQETLIGNLTVDLIKKCTKSDIAMLRCSSVNNHLAPGPITTHDVALLNHCANDRIACVAMTGGEIVTMLEYGAREAYYLLTTSGATVEYEADKEFGERVSRVFVNGQPIERDRTYSVACTEILAIGAGGYEPIIGKDAIVISRTVNDILVEYVQAEGTIRASLDGRLIIHGHLPTRSPS